MSEELVDTSDLESWLKTALMACSIILVAMIVTSALLLNASFSLQSDDLLSSQSSAETVETLLQLDFYAWIGLLSILVVTSLIYLRWLYHVVGNAESILGNFLEVRPGWAVFWHFVPLMNLRFPPAILRSVLIASAIKQQDKGEEHLTQVGFWW